MCAVPSLVDSSHYVPGLRLLDCERLGTQELRRNCRELTVRTGKDDPGRHAELPSSPVDALALRHECVRLR